jgi:hypothetical protein
MKKLVIILFALSVLSGTIHATQTSPEGKSGLTVVIDAARAVIVPGEAVALRITFRNTSMDAFRLPDEINPPPYNFWYLKLHEVNSGKLFTGISTIPMGAAPEPGEIHPVLMQSGETKTVSAAFPAFAFVEGDMDFQAARNIWFPQRGNPAQFALPAGTYDVRVDIRFRSFPSLPNAPERVRDARAAIENNPIPLWKGGEILSNATQIRVGADAIASNSETMQIARNRADSVLDLVKTAREDSSFVSQRIHAGLWSDLSMIETASTVVKDDDGKDLKVSSARIKALNDALAQAATRALDIAGRTNERPEDRTRARQLSMKLRASAAPIPEGKLR